MTTALAITPAGRPIAVPTRAAVAAAITRAQTRPAVVAVVELEPAPPAPAPTPATIPHKRRLPSEPAPDETPAVTRDRLRWIDCSAGRHVWAEIPAHLGPDVCRHCPERADQADRIRAHRQARAAEAGR